MGNPFKRNQDKENVITKVMNTSKPQEGIKDQIVVVTQRLEIQSRSLDTAVKRFEMRDGELFRKVVRAMENRDQARANIYATELCEIRKVEKMLTHASLALQSVSMRLSTVSEMGDLVAILSPATTMLNSVRSEMCSIMPEASQELDNIGGMLTEICSSTTNQYSNISSVGTQVANEEALKILEEAEFAAESKLSDRLPEVMPMYGVQNRKSLEA